MNPNIVQVFCVENLSIPSVPEFTLRFVDLSYDIPPTYGIDQFTGETIMTKAGYHVDERTLEFIIKNQDFTPYQDADGNDIILYYDFRFKGTYGDEWSNYPDRSHTWGGFPSTPYPDIKASNSNYTVIKVKVKDLTDYTIGTLDIQTDVQVQFQVQAIIGYIESDSLSLSAGGFIGYYGERSDWSETQTITIGETTTNETIPEFPSWIIFPLFLGSAFVMVVVKKKNGFGGIK
jgi:hypothetical protein